MIPEDMPGWLVLTLAFIVFAIGIVLWIQAQSDYHQPESEEETISEYSPNHRQRRVPRQFINAITAILISLYLLAVAWKRL